MKMNNILITSAGQRVSLVRAFQNEAKKFDASIKVYTIDLNPEMAPACYVSDGYKQVKRVSNPDYINELIKICKDWNIRIVIPTIDTELLVLSENKKKLLNENIIPVVSDIDFVKSCRDKRIINDFFEKNGIDIPKQMQKDNLSFPLFIKPFDGSLSKDIFIVNDESELTEYHFTNPKFMFMEYIDCKEYDEYTVDTYYDKKGILKCAVPRKRIFVRAGEINKGITCKNEILDCLKSKLNYIDGAVGCLTMQFFFHSKSKRIIGIEINPRFGGGYPLSYGAGANYPKYIIEEYIFGYKIEYNDSWDNNLLMLRYDDEIFVRNYEK
jgi:carbamoyl-phosphate synthase large subunit